MTISAIYWYGTLTWAPILVPRICFRWWFESLHVLIEPTYFLYPGSNHRWLGIFLSAKNYPTPPPPTNHWSRFPAKMLVFGITVPGEHFPPPLPFVSVNAHANFSQIRISKPIRSYIYQEICVLDRSRMLSNEDVSLPLFCIGLVSVY